MEGDGLWEAVGLREAAGRSRGSVLAWVWRGAAWERGSGGLRGEVRGAPGAWLRARMYPASLGEPREC